MYITPQHQNIPTPSSPPSVEPTLPPSTIIQQTSLVATNTRSHHHHHLGLADKLTELLHHGTSSGQLHHHRQQDSASPSGLNRLANQPPSESESLSSITDTTVTVGTVFV
ncbi:uncharacterized protein LOC141907072 [Tubulanus polymorphus]|uniref:uncharacterized protein LOC141907072 n=1 Tax=Tubulanus polymorphus TaxID=672921 RepID=UPI003DA1ED89